MSNNILICGANWLGDSLMSMPAIQLLRKLASRVQEEGLSKTAKWHKENMKRIGQREF